MSQNLDAAAKEAPAQPASGDAAKPAWKLIEDAALPDLPATPDRRGRARGLLILILGGGFFWVVVAVAIVWLSGGHRL